MALLVKKSNRKAVKPKKVYNMPMVKPKGNSKGTVYKYGTPRLVERGA